MTVATAITLLQAEVYAQRHLRQNLYMIDHFPPMQ
jgi:hypothetical protein